VKTGLRRACEHLVDDSAQILDLNRFGEKPCVGRIGDFREDVAGMGLAAHEEDRRFGRGVVAAQIFEKMGAGIPRHVVIEQDKVGSKGAAHLHPFGGIPGAFDRMSSRGQRHRQQLHEIRIVIDQQYLRHSPDSIGSPERAVKELRREFCRN